METLFTFTMYLQDSQINFLNKKLLFTLYIFLNNIKKTLFMTFTLVNFKYIYVCI